MMIAVGILPLAALVAQVHGHGYVATFTVNGVEFPGFRRLDAPPIPNSIGWSFSTPDEGAVVDATSADMICRHDGKNAPGSAPIAAGQEVDFSWTSADLERNPDGWAKGHRGPVITYLAACNGPCDKVDKTTLRWNKIAEAGLISGSANREGVWATDLLRQGNNSAMIPTSIAPGSYVIRNEIIALHIPQKPEFYMACASLEVTKGGNDDLSDKGVLATELYKPVNKQLYGFSIYESTDNSWPIPGPPLYKAVNRGGSAKPDGVEASPFLTDAAASPTETGCLRYAPCGTA